MPRASNPRPIRRLRFEEGGAPPVESPRSVTDVRAPGRTTRQRATGRGEGGGDFALAGFVEHLAEALEKEAEIALGFSEFRRRRQRRSHGCAR